jgi:hypothetical protein
MAAERPEASLAVPGAAEPEAVRPETAASQPLRVAVVEQPERAAAVRPARVARRRQPVGAAAVGRLALAPVDRLGARVLAPAGRPQRLATQPVAADGAAVARPPGPMAPAQRLEVRLPVQVDEAAVVLAEPVVEAEPLLVVEPEEGAELAGRQLPWATTSSPT